MNREQVVITGGNGQLGRALRERYPGAVAIDIGELDIADAGAVESFAWSGIRLVINAAAYTNVDGAETREGRAAAWRVNALAVANLARVAIARGITLVHVSTDYVFDGSRAPYAEAADLSPLGVYGASKAAGEVAAGFVPRGYLLRTSWLIGDGKNFARTMLDLARRGVNPRVVSDQVGRPTFAAELARAIDHLVGTGAAYGIYHVSNGGPPVSWAGFTREIFSQAGVSNIVSDITTAAYHAGAAGGAPRPPDSSFDLTKVRSTGFEPRDWRESLADYLKTLRLGTGEAFTARDVT
jgi:dTDP-4-dehydrorhamnose 3,5-epimerase/reductase